MTSLSRKFCQNLLISFYIMLLTSTHSHQKNRKTIPVSRWWSVTFPKCSCTFLVSCPTYPKNFMKIHALVFSIKLLTDTDSTHSTPLQENRTKCSCVQMTRNIPKVCPIASFIMNDLSWNFDEHLFLFFFNVVNRWTDRHMDWPSNKPTFC